MNAPDVIHDDQHTLHIVNGDVKILKDQESDARHEPRPAKLDDASVIPELGTPLDPDSIPIHPPHGTPPPPQGELLPDVEMAEQQEQSHEEEPQEEEPHINGINGDIHMADTDVQTPATTPGANDILSGSQADLNESSAYTTPNVDLDDDKPPPAKRPRVHSDADMASIAHSITPPPASTITSNGTTPVPPPSATAPTQLGPSTFSHQQFRFCQSVLRTLKKQKDAVPFLRPVDPVVLNIPHYPSIIKNPMDFSTIERKLSSSNPSKPDPNPNNPRYLSGEDFISDVRLIFSNCLAFNGPEHAVSNMGKRVEEVFDKQIKNMPVSDIKPIIRKTATPPPPAPVPAQAKKGQTQPRRNSTVVPTIRRSDTELIGRPKREIHPPPPKDLPYADAPKKYRKSKRAKDGVNSEQMKFCSKLLDGMFNKKQYGMAHPFYEPVDWVKLDIPTYPKIVKKPMDLSTMRKKLDQGEYPTAERFFEDFKLMIRNCFLFNPAGTPVNQAGIELQRWFDEKWKGLPTARDASDDEEDEEEDDSDDERARAIAMMESQIETMKNNLSALKSKPAKDKKKKEKREKPSAAPSTSKVASKPSKPSSGKKKKNKLVANDDVLTYDQKKDLSEAIGGLDGAKLERVIQIIHDGVPEIRDSTEEIELDIDLLPPSVLIKLHNFVIRKPPTTKRNRPGKGTGTGGLKRKSMDEDVEAEKIRQLEQRMKLFEGGANGYSVPTPKGDDSERSSDSSSGSESSGSESE